VVDEEDDLLQVSEGKHCLTAGAGGVAVGGGGLYNGGVHGGWVEIVVVNVSQVDEGGVGRIKDGRNSLVGVCHGDGVAAGAPHDVVVEDEGQLGVDIIIGWQEECWKIKSGGGDNVTAYGLI